MVSVSKKPLSYSNLLVPSNNSLISETVKNSASKVILLYKDKDNNENSEIGMNVEIAKNRDGIMGIVRMNYNREKQIFKELWLMDWELYKIKKQELLQQVLTPDEYDEEIRKILKELEGAENEK